MYLSSLLIDTGQNPDRPRPGRLWLRNLYRVHQRLCMGFPSKQCTEGDPDFLKPYKPEHFPEDRQQAEMKLDPKPDKVQREILAHVHAKRDDKAGFLFRVDPKPAGRAVVLVVSAIEPIWDYAFHNARHFLAAPPDSKQYRVDTKCGQRMRFRLQANPTRKVHALPEGSARTTPLTKNGRRVPVPATDDALIGWLEQRADLAGFRLEGKPEIQPGYVYVNKTGKAGQGHRLRSVLYEGILEVTNADNFAQALASGIGPAKAFGFGLLSVAPLRS